MEKINTSIEQYITLGDFNREVFTHHANLDNEKRIKMLYSYTENNSDKDLAECFLDNIYQVMVENYDKGEIYERIEEMEKLIHDYLKKVKYWE